MSCQHLRAADPAAPTSAYADGCPACRSEGFTGWVHLRVCLTCGVVGCCDSSPRRHMSRHAAETGHPVMGSFEPGESWRWCFLDEALG